MGGDRVSSNGKGSNVLVDRPSRPRASERLTRAPAVFWDRIKLLIFLGILWLTGLAVVWSTSVKPLDGPLIDAIRIATNDYWWLLALMGIEFLRQVHYFIEERSKGYYHFWQQTVFGGTGRRLGKMNDYTRYRAGRAFKFLLFLLVFSTLLGRIFNTDPVWLGIVEAPARLVVALPFVMQLAFGFFFVMFQFIGLFWFLSRGGIDTIMPDEIETRFDDVKGQDAALGQLKETLVFLDDPESIESRGGYVPGGILLWGPPGTGKTLMAQAVAGETAKPFVNVDAGAFINMFMGVGILKVRSLYRKLRKLSMRYGGAIVFIDEADSLGSRGQQAVTGYTPTSPWTTGTRVQRPRVRVRAGARRRLPRRITAARHGSSLQGARDHGRHGRRRRHGHAAGPACGDVGSHQAEGAREQDPQATGHEAQAPAQVPHPAHLRDQHAEHARPGDASARTGRPTVQGRVSPEGWPQGHVRLLPTDGPERHHGGTGRQARHDHSVLLRRLDQGHRERRSGDRDPRRSRHRHLHRCREGEAAEAARSAR